jgi:gliding motility-associated-like protein
VANNSVKTFAPPISSFTFNNACLFDSMMFTNTSLNPTPGTIANWSWNFGDGSPLNTQVWSPSHLYNNSGNYQVTLITHSSNLACADTLQHTITIYHLPLANFGFTNVCLNQGMNFHDSSLIVVDTISGWSWNFGDATPLIALQNPHHTYSSPGTYNVSLIVTTNHGCKNTVVKSVVVHPLPDVQFSRTNVCDRDSVRFTDLSTIATTDTLQSQKWNFGDGSLLNTNQNPAHLYATAGFDTVKLLVISKFGCLDSTIKTSIINPNPIVNFAALNKIGCAPLCVNFQDSSFITTGHNVQWMWNFGDGNNGSEPNHCYTNDSVFAPKSFSVTLTVTSDSGCVSAKSKNNYVIVYPKPNAGFRVQPSATTIIDPIISITDLSSGANFWVWNFGDHDTTTKHTPTPHTYADTGTYVITLITSTHYGCVDTAYQTITIEPDFEFFIPNSFSPNDDGVNDTFSGKGIFIKEYEMYIFDRWGNLIFFSDDINNPWDGTANHGIDIAQRDVYVYSMKVTDIKNTSHSYRGSVTLIR